MKTFIITFIVASMYGFGWLIHIAPSLMACLMLPYLFVKFFNKNELFFKIFNQNVNIITIFFGVLITLAINILISSVQSNWSIFLSKPIHLIANINVVLCSIFLHPIVEEVFFRGTLLPILYKLSQKKWPSIVLQATCFALFHQHIEQILPSFFIGLFWGYMSMKKKAIGYALMFHIFNNSVFWITNI